MGSNQMAAEPVPRHTSSFDHLATAVMVLKAGGPCGLCGCTEASAWYGKPPGPRSCKKRACLRARQVARGIDTPATGDGGASPGGGSRFWPRSAVPLGKAALAGRRRRIFFHYWAVQIAHPPSENRGEVMLCHRLHPATILRVLSAFFALLLSLSCAGLALLQLCSS